MSSTDWRKGNRSRPNLRPANLAIFLVTVTAATAISIWARDTAHPVTAAMVFVLAVLINGATGGLFMGLAAACVASFIYNGFIRFPVYRFGLGGIDDFVPLLALTITAVTSGVLAGRFADRARAAEQARAQLGRLLQFSTELQTAINLRDIVDALRRVIRNPVICEDILGGLPVAHSFRDPDAWHDALTGRDAAGAVVTSEPMDSVDRDMFVSLLSLAVERCELLAEQSHAEAVIESERLKTALLSAVSHDLRTPLAAISASASSLIRYGDDLDSDSKTEMLEMIRQQCDRLDSFTSKLLTLGRLAAGLTEKDLEIVDVEEMLGSAIATARQIAPQRRIVASIAPGQSLTIANPVLLQQVLHNVLENAARYSSPDSEIRVSLEQEDGMIAASIADRGTGIDEKDLPHIFDRFYRGSGTTDTSGHGLGLSIAKAFVDAMGGRIIARSPTAAGPGTEIRILLPRLAEERS